MHAYARHLRMTRPRERVIALAAVGCVQAVVGLALLSGLRVEMQAPGEIVQRLIKVTLEPPPPPATVKPTSRPKPLPANAPKSAPEKPGGTSGPKPAPAAAPSV